MCCTNAVQENNNKNDLVPSIFACVSFMVPYTAFNETFCHTNNLTCPVCSFVQMFSKTIRLLNRDGSNYFSL